MDIVITGGTGFIGSRLALACQGMGHRVRVIGQVNNAWEDRTRRELASAGIPLKEGPVTDAGFLLDALSGADVVFHLAAAQHEASLPDQHFWRVNVTGTRTVLKASAAAGVGRVVHGSTIGVYGSSVNGALDERSPSRPDNIYGVTKLEGERLALSFADRLPLVVIRISETYGPGDQRLLKLFKATRRKVFPMPGQGANLHHPIYVQDLIEGLLLAATKDEAVGNVFVLAGTEMLTTREMVKAISAEMASSARVVSVPLFPVLAAAQVAGKAFGAVGVKPPLHPRRMDFFRKDFHFSYGHAQRELGFSPRYSFAEGVRETAAWYRKEGLI
jgi:nucleoside-diphosphate-sugar epimerase